MENQGRMVKREDLVSTDTEEKARNEELKRKVVILDCVGLYNRFGLPEDKWDWDKFFVGMKKGEGRRWKHLGLDSDDENMTEIDTQRVTAMKKMRREKNRSTLQTFNARGCLWGIRNLCEEVIVEPCCKELTQTNDGWFYGKDTEGNLLIYDTMGVLVFKREHSEIEISRDGRLFILAKAIDGEIVRIGPFDKYLHICEKSLRETQAVIYDSTEDITKRFVTVYVVRNSGVAMTSYKLALDTRFFKKMVHYLRYDLFVGLDNRIYKFSTSRVLYPIKLPEREVRLIMTMK